MFETKNKREKNVENTNHYIPNIIISTLIVLLIKYIWNNDNNKKYMLFILNIFLLTSFSILISTSIYLWNIYNNKYN
jgi:predicted membrane channel-forming protein YqfA (hemolysin III family)